METWCFPVGEVNYKKPKTLTGDYAHCYGDVVFGKVRVSGMDKFMERFYQMKDTPKFYKGKTSQVALCKDPYSNQKEIHDLKDLSLAPDHELVEGEELLLVNTRWKKPVIYLNKMSGIFYKWESQSGFYLLFSEDEIRSLTSSDRRYLRIEM